MIFYTKETFYFYFSCSKIMDSKQDRYIPVSNNQFDHEFFIKNLSPTTDSYP